MKSIKSLLKIFFFIALSFAEPPFAQSLNLDSLLKISKIEKDPVKKCDKYLDYISKLSPSNRDSAMKLVILAETDYEKNHFKYGQARALSIKAWFLIFNSKYEESLKTGHKALVIQKEISDSLGIALTLNRIGLANMQFKRYKDAESYISQAYIYFKRFKDSSRIDMTLNNLGVLATEQGLNLKAIEYYKKSLSIRTAQKKYYWMAYSYFNIGEVYLQSELTDSAQYYLIKAYQTFSEKTEAGKVPSMVSLGLAKLFYQQKKYNESLKYVQEGISEAEKSNHTEIIFQGKGMLGDILFNLKRYKEAFDAQSEYIELKNQIDSTNNTANVAEVEARYKNAEKEAEIARLKTLKLEAENKVQSFRLYMVTSIAVFILFAGLLTILWQRRNQKVKINEAGLNAKIAEAKMFALRAQMNPHFIFNCINTAQNFIMNNQKEQAYEYLSNFAKLLRLVMENSSKTFVQLEDEMDQLKLYVELEAIRFSNKFKYEIIIDEDLKNGIFEIPGMIIQPLVENAIGHGLINRKDDDGKLVIHLKMKDPCIVCEIIDNGVGRERAGEIKAAKNIRYQSAAIPNIKERLRMLQSEMEQNIDLNIFDEVENGVSKGTRAVLTLPFQ